MTREEHLTAKIERKKALLEKRRQELAQDEARLREETRQATNKRRYQVGALADEAGLLAWSNADLAGAFALLARFTAVVHPIAVLEELLSETPLVAVGSENGVAEAGPRVSAAH